MSNAGIQPDMPLATYGIGIDATTGEKVDMIKSGIIDPVLVTKTALKNAVSVATTIMSADCIISNMRLDMQAINYYIVIRKIKEAAEKVAGLELTEDQNDDVRYLKG